jgi:hypothetical protein
MDQNVADTTPPTLKLLGSAMITLPEGETYMEPGVMVKNAYDQANGYDLVTEGSINNAAPGDYTLTYTATDKAGNVANITRTVRVVDTTRPVITLEGEALITIQVGSTYTDQGATVTDNVDATRIIQTADSVDSNTVGNYTLRYNAVDADGNAATEVTRTVKVVDTTRPVITLEGDASITIQGG